MPVGAGLRLGDTPWHSKAFVLVGALSYSGRFRAWISSSLHQAHLVEGIDAVLRHLGGTARRWRMCSDGDDGALRAPTVSSLRSWGWPNTTGWGSTPARQDVRTAKA